MKYKVTFILEAEYEIDKSAIHEAIDEMVEIGSQNDEESRMTLSNFKMEQVPPRIVEETTMESIQPEP